MIPSKVVADEREKASGVPDELAKLNVRVYFSRLAVGDYVLSPELAVERKTVRDLVSSVYDSRLFYQAARLSASYAKPFLLVEGDSKQVEALAKNVKSFFGAIAMVSLTYGLRVLYTANAAETAAAISELLRHSRSKPTTRMPSEAPPKSKSVSQHQVYIVSSLPGVGMKLAERLLAKYGTPGKIMGLTAGELAMTQGIGWKRAQKIREVLDARFSRNVDGRAQLKLEG